MGRGVYGYAGGVFQAEIGASWGTLRYSMF